MANERSPTQYKGVRAIAPPDLTLAKIAPPAGFNPIKGQLYLDTVAESAYMFSGANWIALGSGATGGVVTLTGTTGGAISPIAGNMDILGTAAAGISFAGTAGTLTAHIAAATPIQRATLETTTDAESVTGTSLIVAVTPASLTARLAAPGAIGGTTPSSGAFTTLTSTTTMIAGTSLTATLGNITATNGNIVRGTAGNKDVYTSVASTATAGANSAGTVTLVGGTATITTTAVTASSQIRLYRQGVGSTGAAALGMLSLGTVSAGVSFIINAVQAADATALQASDVSVIGWEIVN